MGVVFKRYFGGGSIYRCSGCLSDLALADELVSKAFQGRHGRAFLFSTVINVQYGPLESRQLTTGLHTVRDIYCSNCDIPCGWHYSSATEQSQKYKEGKFCVEKEKIIKVKV